MAAGSDFTLVPNEVVTEEPKFHNISTKSESMKKEYFNLSATSINRYTLQFNALSNTNRDTLLTHYNDQYGGYHSFAWKSVPSYIGAGANITGRWVEGSLKMTPSSSTYWSCEIQFEKAN